MLMPKQITGEIKPMISLILLLFINFLFSYKYLIRITEFAFSISIVLSVFYLFLFYFSDKINFKLFKIAFISALSLLLILFVFAFTKIPQESLKVDRWSVIIEFWDAYFEGIYPYGVKSNDGNYPGPMPFYFFLALPFYFIKEIGYFSIAGLLLLIGFIYKTDKNKVFILTFLISSLIIFWEVLTRSTVLINGTLILIYFYYLEKVNFSDLKKLIIFGLIGGLVLSIRTVFVLTFILSFIYFLRTKRVNFKQTIIYGVSLVFSFALTFIPFSLPYGNLFFEINPFIVQSSFLIPPIFILLFILIAIITSFFCNNTKDYFFYNGIVIFLTFLIYITYHSINEGFMNAYLNSYFDISYFILSIPFLLFSLNARKVNNLKL